MQKFLLWQMVRTMRLGSSHLCHWHAVPKQNVIRQQPEHDKEFAVMAQMVLDDIVSHSPGVKFDAIAGLDGIKHALQEAIILPSQRPDLFQGLRCVHLQTTC